MMTIEHGKGTPHLHANELVGVEKDYKEEEGKKWKKSIETFTIVMLIYALLVSLTILLVSLLCFLKKKRVPKLNLPPSPPKLSIIGNLHQVGTLPHRSLRSLSQKYGSLMILNFGCTPTLIVSSADMVADIMKNNDVTFSNRPKTRAMFAISNGYRDVGFSPYNEHWKQAKKICLYELLSQSRVRAFRFAREETITRMVAKVGYSCQCKAVVDVSEILSSIANEILSRSAFGRVYESVEGGESFGEMAGKAIDFLEAFCFEDFFPFLGWMDYLTGYRARLHKSVMSIYDFLDQVIEEHRASFTEESNAKDFVDVLLHLQKYGAKNINFTNEEIKAIIMDMFLGGSDTSHLTLEWAMAEIVRNPSKMKKVQAEVRGVVGNNSIINETDLEQMEYLKCIVKETLRLHPPVSAAPRATLASCKLGGYDIPKDMRVMINIWTIHRDPNYWDSAEEFIPERFENNSIDYVDQSYNYMPFGGGRRMCPGMPFTSIIAKLVLANLLHWFDWEVPSGARPEDLDMNEAMGISNRKKIPLKLVPLMHVF